MVELEVTPEQPAQHVGQLVQAGVVDSRLAFAQVVHLQVADRPAFDAVAADQLRDVQDYAGHKDARTTRRYDHSRDSLDRNPAYTVAAYLA